MVTCNAPMFTETVTGSEQRPSLWARMAARFSRSRSTRVLCLIAGIWLLNAFDLSLTALSHNQGFLHEQNPVARHMLKFGLLSVVLYKIGLVLIGTYPLVKYRTARITELGALVVLIAYATVAIRWSQCYDWYSLSAAPTAPHVTPTVQLEEQPS